MNIINLMIKKMPAFFLQAFCSCDDILPKLGAFVGIEPHFVALFDRPCLLELANMRQRDVDAVTCKCMDIHLGQLQLGLVADVACPNCCVSKEETLFGWPFALAFCMAR